MEMTPQQALAKLQMQCSKAEYCTSQIREKLFRWRGNSLLKGELSFTEEDMESIINQLIDDNFIDDARFAGAYVRDKARFAKWGEVKIVYNLKRLGINGSVIKMAMDENRELFGSRVLQELLQKRWGQMKEGDSLESKRAKLLRFALGRGYDYGQIMDVIKSFR